MTIRHRKASRTSAIEAIRTQLHRAAFDAELWSQTLGELCVLLEADAACAFLPTRTLNLGVAHDSVTWNLPPFALADAIARETGRVDAFTEGGARKGLLGKSWIGVSQQLVDDRDCAENPFSQYFAEGDLRHYLGFITTDDQHEGDGASGEEAAQGLRISFFRSHAAGAFDIEHLKLLAQVRQEAVRSANMLFRLRAAEHRAALAETALKCVADAVLMLTPDLKVALANPAGEALFAKDGPLTIVHRRVRATTSEGQIALDRCVQLYADGVSGDVVLAAPNGIKHRAMVTPSPTGDGFVLVAPAQPCTALLRQRLADIYGLTPAEIDITVRLKAADSVAAIARARGVSELTVRTQMRAIYAKLSIKRQAHLMRLLETLSRPGG